MNACPLAFTARWFGYAPALADKPNAAIAWVVLILAVMPALIFRRFRFLAAILNVLGFSWFAATARIHWAALNELSTQTFIFLVLLLYALVYGLFFWAQSHVNHSRRPKDQP